MRTRGTVSGRTREWPMLSAIGVGLVFTATAAGALGPAVGTAESTGLGRPAAAAILAGCGVAALGWAVLALHAGRLPWPRATLAVALTVFAASAGLLASGAAPSLGVAPLPLLAADLLVLVVAGGAALELRMARGRPGGAAAVAAPARGSVFGLIVGAALVSALVTPALAGTAAGDLAVPHGEQHGTEHGHH
ncbi:hypothetical protein BCL57_000604 [Agromyces flavus]|uniref:Uncharacterized protein n=1 Tax=Agromyces flavus TaxID=589382 RepID=A0A1H1XN84_9MICO|nr:hypothetical protein [Agromyces flavus]MCP2366462.1 hypothetical protein [Agromyces flavus]GGI44724.1 hypothetical protein GCM10010932_06050 [Agromyces flavus]SDT10531.1 hypothetical protein SAMN04489721_2530 [Agromyces flavus]